MVFDYLSDRNGNVSATDLGGIRLTEAVASVLFFLGVGAEFSDFDVQIPIGQTVYDLGYLLGEWSIPVLGTASATLGITLALGLFAWQLIDTARKHGRSNEADLQKFMNDIPTGVTVLTIGAGIALVAALFGWSSILTPLTETYAREMATVVGSTIAYTALSHQA